MQTGNLPGVGLPSLFDSSLSLLESCSPEKRPVISVVGKTWLNYFPFAEVCIHQVRTKCMKYVLWFNLLSLHFHTLCTKIL